MDEKVLIVEDDKMFAELEKLYLTKEGYEVDIAFDGKKGFDMAVKGDYSIVLLDIMLPLMDGRRVCEEIRKTKNIPIIMTTAKHGDMNKIQGYTLGADDYLEKPFTPEMLIARVDAHVKRYKSLVGTDSSVLLSDGLKVDAEARRVFVGEKEVELRNREFEMLLFFMNNKNKVFSKDSILEHVWGYDYEGGDETVPVHINRLREKLGPRSDGDHYIQTVKGAGYILRDTK